MTAPLSRAAARAARAAQAARDTEEAEARAAARADAFVAAFVNMTPAQVSSYLDANVTDLASARNVLKKLALMVLLLAKREYK